MPSSPSRAITQQTLRCPGQQMYLRKPDGDQKGGNEKESAKPVKAEVSDTPADLVDKQLARYREMRDFGITAEPSGAKPAKKKTSWPEIQKSGGLPFVIQKHAASHLHYDFRLGWNGVLKSWACAKGPSYNVKDRRLAVQVEDHPMEYGGFEGIIPQGQYGGGTVMVWDQGTWAPQPGYEDVDAGLRDGHLKFTMSGAKMHGKWALIRMHETAAPKDSKAGRWKSAPGKPNWLLIKEHDEFERGPDGPAVTDEEPNSAVTGRSLDQIAKQEDHVWNSKDTARGEAWYRKEPAPGKEEQAHAPPLKPQGKPIAATLGELPAERQPEFIQPQLAQEASAPPANAGWLHELKLDGYRMQARKSARGVQMLTRSGLDWTYRIPAVAEAVARLPSPAVTLDGEVVVLREDGTTNFADLQASFQEGARNPLTFFCFDLLHIEGRNPRDLPLRDRKALLANVLAEADDTLRVSDHLETDGEAMFHKACELHAEGIVSKRADAAYTPGRSGLWLKCKCLHEQEFVIGGFTNSSDGADRIGSLLLGYFRDGKLIYAGRTGTGFTQKTRRELRQRLASLEQPRPPFVSIVADARRDALFVKPELVAQVRFASWTAEDYVRQAAFLGLREDKPAKEVRREEATAPPKPKSFEADKFAVVPRTKTATSATKLRSDLAEKTTRFVAKTVSEPSAAKPAAVKPLKIPPRPEMRLTHPGKVLDPVSGLTKGELADFYWAVAPYMLPHIANRPLSLVRCPEGAGKPCFYQKHVNHMLPPGVFGVDVPDKTGKLEPYITLNTPEALTGLAQMGVLEIHPWNSQNDDLEHPDRLIFDLDPDEEISWPTVCAAAAEVRVRLKKIGLESWLKTTGGKGLHIVAPILPELSWDQVKSAAHRFVEAMERANPTLYLTKMSKAARRGKIYLDYLRNERGATAVAPFSPRARAGATVSVPLPWSALGEKERLVFSVHDFPSWSGRLRSDPWKKMLTTQQSLDPAAITK